MKFSNTFVAGIVAAALISAPSAEAGPLAGARTTSVEVSGDAIQLAGGGGYRRYHHRNHGGDVGAAVAVGAAALIVGAAIAANASRRDCWVERSRTWSPRRHAYVIVEQTVCD